MKFVQKLLAVVALICLVIGLNALVIRENLFTPLVLGLLGLAAVCGLLWVALFAAHTLRTSGQLDSINTVIGSLAFLGICIVIYALVNHTGWSWDLTREGRRALSPQTQKVLRGLTEDVQVIGLFPVSGDSLTDVVRNKTRRFIDRCAAYTPHLKVEFIDPQRSPDRVEALDVKRVSSVGMVVLKAGVRQRELPLSDITSRLEERDFTNALINVVRDSVPTVYFLTGHGEKRIGDTSPADGASVLGAWLDKESYKTAELSIRVADPSIPSDCDVLVIDGPKGDLNAREIAAIDAYLAQGGRLLVLVDPWIIQGGAGLAAEQLRPWLEHKYGIRIGNDILISLLKEKAIIDLVPDYTALTEYGFDIDPNGEMRGCYDTEHPITRGFDQKMYLYAARTVGLVKPMPDGVTGSEILRTMPDTYAEEDLHTYYGKQTASVDADEQKGSLPVAVAVAAKTNVPVGDSGQTRDARIVVVGDTDFSNNEKIAYTGHHNFILNAIAWLTENEELIAIRPVGDEDPPIVLSQAQQRAVVWIAALGVVQFVALCGVVAHIRRRRHQ